MRLEPIRSRRRWPWILAALLAVGVIPCAGGGLFLWLSSSPDVPDRAVLRLRLAGPLPERDEGDALSTLFEPAPLTVKDVLDALEKAAVDPRIQGVLVELADPELGWAKVEELRGALARFRKSGKPAVAFAEELSEGGYAVALACDRILLPPGAPFELDGLSMEVFHLPGLLEKLGVGVQYFRYGKYKSVSGESFGRKELTGPVREMIEGNLDEQFQRWLSWVAADRKLPAEEIRKLVDDPRSTADWALEHKLIDGLSYFDQVEDELHEKLGLPAGEKVPFVGAQRYRDVSFEDAGVKEGDATVALVYAQGVIVAGGGDSDPLDGEGSQGTVPVIQALRRAAEDEEVKAIVLRVDSPGGSGLGCDFVRREVERLKAKKPIVVSMSDAAASGGYWISMDATAIVAQPSTATGSIGIWAVVPNLRRTYELLGVNPEGFAKGAHAAAFSGLSPLSEVEASRFDAELLEAYQRFVALAAKGRGKSVEQMEAIAQGRTWSGAKALQLGLLDQLGGLPDAVALAARKAGLAEGAPVKVEVFEKGSGLWERLTGEDEEEEVSLAPVLGVLARKLGLTPGLRKARVVLPLVSAMLGRHERYFPMMDPLPAPH